MAQQRFSDLERMAFWHAYDRKCFYCRKLIGFREVRIDHLIPESLKRDEGEFARVRAEYGLEGNYDLFGDGNLCCACHDCNSDKSDAMYPAEQTMILLKKVQAKAELVGKFRQRFAQEKEIDKLIAALSVKLEKEGGLGEYGRLMAELGAVRESVRHANYYCNAPALPRQYVAREEMVQRMRESLLAVGSAPSVALTALRGMGGIGKTVLAQAVAHDREVQEGFPDGVHWFTVGREEKPFEQRLAEVEGLGAKTLGEYRNVMREKAALIVLDDVWDARDVEDFCTVGAVQSRVLITTRDQRVGAVLGAEQVDADLLSEEEAREVLARWSGVAQLPGEAGELIAECGRLPLALALVGAMVRRKSRDYWERVLELLRGADIEKIRSQFAGHHETLFRALDVSFAALEEEAPEVAERYLQLAVVLEDTAVPGVVQRCIWGLDEGEAMDTREALLERSLVQRGEGEGEIRIHDLQLDYVRKKFGDGDALGLIHAAARMSAHVTEKWPEQYAGQMTGRLLGYREMTCIEEFLGRLRKGVPKPALLPLWPSLEPAGGVLVRTLVGDPGRVRAVAVSLDGRWIVAGGSSGEVQVWNAVSGRRQGMLHGHEGEVYALGLSAEGERVVSGCEDGTLRVWDRDSGSEMLRVRSHKGRIRSLALSRDGSWVVSGGLDGTVRLRQIDSGREETIFCGHAGEVCAVAISRDGKLIVSGGRDGTVRVWDVDSSRELQVLRGEGAAVWAVALSADGEIAVSGGRDGFLRLWEVRSGKELKTIRGHADGVWAVEISEDGRTVVSVGNEGAVRVWDVEDGRECRRFGGHEGPVWAGAFSKGRNLLVTAGIDGKLRLWDWGREGKVLKAQDGCVDGVAASRDGRFVVTGGRDGMVCVREGEAGRELSQYKGHEAAVLAVAMSEDGRRIVSGSDDGAVCMWDADYGGRGQKYREHAGKVWAVAMSRDGKHVASAGNDGTVRVLSDGQGWKVLHGHKGMVRAVAMSDEGERIASSGGWDGTVRVWDGVRGEEWKELQGHQSPAWAVAISSDGRSVGSGGEDGIIRLWDCESGRALRNLSGHQGVVWGLELCEGGRVLSCGTDATVRLWDGKKERELCRFHGDGAFSCCAASGSHRIFAGDRFGRLHLLELVD